MSQPQRRPSTYVVSLTPFDRALALDEAALRAHLRRMAAAGVGVYLGGSGSGEGYALSTDELQRVLEIGAEELCGRVPVLAMGVEPRHAAQMIELARRVRAVGLDGMQLYSLDPGHGNRPSARELERYLRDVLEQVELPIVLSSHQSVGYFLPAPLIASLIERYPQIIGINCSSPDVTYLLRVIEAVAGRADVHVGGPMLALCCLSLGGQGFLSSDANLAPRLCARVVERWAAGDLSGCAAAWARLMRLFAATRDLGGIPATKAALALLGLPGGGVRPPRLPLPDAVLPEVQARMLDAIEWAAFEAPGQGGVS